MRPVLFQSWVATISSLPCLIWAGCKYICGAHISVLFSLQNIAFSPATAHDMWNSNIFPCLKMSCAIKRRHTSARPERRLHRPVVFQYSRIDSDSTSSQQCFHSEKHHWMTMEPVSVAQLFCSYLKTVFAEYTITHATGEAFALSISTSANWVKLVSILSYSVPQISIADYDASVSFNELQ